MMNIDFNQAFSWFIKSSKLLISVSWRKSGIKAVSVHTIKMWTTNIHENIILKKGRISLIIECQGKGQSRPLSEALGFIIFGLKHGLYIQMFIRMSQGLQWERWGLWEIEQNMLI